MSFNNRYQGLDFLRGIAIVGVLFRHLEIDAWIKGPGGYGVDLFFVLSGFLVSGLLFSEYKRNGKINAGRFLIRRGFKIYPSFYLFILTSIVFFAVFYHSYFFRSSIVSEVFFLQSYIRGMWSHTWSLAVEEHFYIILVIVTYLFAKFNRLQTGWIAFFFISMIITTVILRYYFVHYIRSNDNEAFYYTHLRMDGLFTGALLGYVWHFKKHSLNFIYERKKFFVLMILILASPAFILKINNTFMLTYGYNLFHIACAFAILLLISGDDNKKSERKNILTKSYALISLIGVYSYSIYLWHIPVQNILLRYIPNLAIESIIYLTLSLAIGIGVSKLIERPMLKLRDKYFPAK